MKKRIFFRMPDGKEIETINVEFIPNRGEQICITDGANVKKYGVRYVFYYFSDFGKDGAPLEQFTVEIELDELHNPNHW